MNKKKNKKIIAILPMRKGSKRLKNKNLKILGNKHLYEIIINTLLKCKMISKICINTDISKIIKQYNQNKKIIILQRDKNLQGNCNINKVIKSTIDKIDGNYFIQVHCTNPFLRSKTIDENINKFLLQKKYNSFFSVTEIQKRFWNQNGTPQNHKFFDEPTTQNLKILFEENSCFYIFTRQSFNQNCNRIGDKAKMICISKTESFDLDVKDDFLFAKNFFNDF